MPSAHLRTADLPKRRPSQARSQAAACASERVRKDSRRARNSSAVRPCAPRATRPVPRASATGQTLPPDPDSVHWHPRPPRPPDTGDCATRPSKRSHHVLLMRTLISTGLVFDARPVKTGAAELHYQSGHHRPVRVLPPPRIAPVAHRFAAHLIQGRQSRPATLSTAQQETWHPHGWPADPEYQRPGTSQARRSQCEVVDRDNEPANRPNRQRRSRPRWSASSLASSLASSHQWSRSVALPATSYWQVTRGRQYRVPAPEPPTSSFCRARLECR